MNADPAKWWKILARKLSGQVVSEQDEKVLSTAKVDPELEETRTELEQLWIAAGFPVPENDNWDTAGEWERFRDTTAGLVPKEKFRRLGLWPLMRVAALLLVLLGIAALIFLTGKPGSGSEWIAFAAPADLESPMEVLLPDSSQVWLNRSTELRYREMEGKRTVHLLGEAFFDVHHDERVPFEITSGATRTTVLGTSFNIRAYPGEEQVEVTVSSGRVRVEATSLGEELFLEKDQAAIYRGESGSLKELEKAGLNAKAWLSGNLTFRNASVEQVLSDLERYYDQTMVVENPEILRCRFKGNFEDPKLETVLQVLSIALDLEIRESGDTVYLAGPGCTIQ